MRIACRRPEGLQPETNVTHECGPYLSFSVRYVATCRDVAPYHQTLRRRVRPAGQARRRDRARTAVALGDRGGDRADPNPRAHPVHAAVPSGLHLHDLIHRHHVVVEVRHDPERTGHEQQDDQHAEGARRSGASIVQGGGVAEGSRVPRRPNNSGRVFRHRRHRPQMLMPAPRTLPPALYPRDRGTFSLGKLIVGKADLLPGEAGQ
jgi:hypothetical protein